MLVNGDRTAPLPKPPSAQAERVDQQLARNLIIARMAASLTQEGLAEAAGISRATIAQIESGSSDPRLSTVVELARALRVSPLLLLFGPDVPPALAALLTSAPADPLTGLSAADRDRIRRLLDSGFSKSRMTAVRIALQAGVGAGLDQATLAGLGIGIAMRSDAGASLIAALARLLSEHP